MTLILRFLFIAFLLAPASLGAEELWLRVGEIRSLKAAPNAVIRVGARGVVKVVDGGADVRVIGLKPGHTELAVDGRAISVRVSLSSQKDFFLALRHLIKNMMGLKLHADGDRLNLTGTLLRLSDWERIADLARHLRGEYEFRAQALPDVAKAALTHLYDLAKTSGFPIVRFAADPEFTAYIPKAAGSLHSVVERTYAAYGIRVQDAGSDLALAPLIRTRVILAEVSKNWSRQFGVQWPAEKAATLLPQLESSDQVLLTLRALEDRGQAQILASPSLLCRSGGEALFHSGGEFPVRVFNGTRSATVLWKPHGVILKVKPQADFQGSISLDVETEISFPDEAHAVDGVPALKTNAVHSQFDVPGKRTIALSGLLRQELGQSAEGLPFLTGVPLLGALFSSRKFLNHQSELVIFVTPEIHVPAQDEKVQMPEGWVNDAL